jgi:hypothetical protein
MLNGTIAPPPVAGEITTLIATTTTPTHIEELLEVPIHELTTEQSLTVIGHLETNCQEYFKKFLAQSNAYLNESNDSQILTQRNVAGDRLTNRGHYLITFFGHSDELVVGSAYEAFCRIFCVYHGYPSMYVCRRYIDDRFGAE